MSGIFDAGIFDSNIFDEGETLMSGSASINRHKRGEVTLFGNPSSSGNTVVLAAPGVGIMIRVLSLTIINGGTSNSVKFQSATTDITCLFSYSPNGGMVLDHNKAGHFQTAANEALNINLSGATAVGYLLNYQLTQV